MIRPKEEDFEEQIQEHPGDEIITITNWDEYWAARDKWADYIEDKLTKEQYATSVKLTKISRFKGTVDKLEALLSKAAIHIDTETELKISVYRERVLLKKNIGLYFKPKEEN